MADRSVAAERLGPLLAKIREGFQQSLDSIQLSLKQGNSEWPVPMIEVQQADIATAALYLRDLGLSHDALRLNGAFKLCNNRCFDECLASLADGKSEEFRDWLTEKYGKFPVQVDPNDHTVFDRQTLVVGLIAQLLEFVDELIGTVNAVPLSLTPPQYLTSWREILVALGMKDNKEDQTKVRKLNKTYSGPIITPRSGAQPKVDKAKLLEWWNGLEQEFREDQQRQSDAKATIAAQHPYGRGGTVVPDIAGGVKKRRRDSTE